MLRDITFATTISRTSELYIDLHAALLNTMSSVIVSDHTLSVGAVCRKTLGRPCTYMLFQAVGYFVLTLLLDAHHTGRLRLPSFISRHLEPLIDKYDDISARVTGQCAQLWNRLRGSNHRARLGAKGGGNAQGEKSEQATEMADLPADSR